MEYVSKTWAIAAVLYCAICGAFNFFTLSRRESSSSTRKQPGKGHADYLLAIRQERARARACVLLRAWACVRVFTGRTSERRGAELYEHRLYSLETTSSKPPPLPSSPNTHTGSSPADTAADTFLCSVRKPTRSFGYFFMDFNAWVNIFSSTTFG